MLFTVAN